MKRRMLRLSTWVCRRLLPLLALVGFLRGTIGAPVPQRFLVEGEAPFPCQGHHCGCKTAGQCWQSCCCLTNRQKVEWAAEHGVTPPASVVSAAKHEEAKGACCASGQRRAGEESVKRPSGWSIEFVSAVQARKCQGQAELWLSLGAAPPLPANVTAASDLTPAGRVCAISISLSSVCEAPQSPPPRA